MSQPFYWKVYSRIDGEREPMAKFVFAVDAIHWAHSRALNWARFETSDFVGAITVEAHRVKKRFYVDVPRYGREVRTWDNPKFV